jgi:hypothetical protein
MVTSKSLCKMQSYNMAKTENYNNNPIWIAFNFTLKSELWHDMNCIQ